MIKTLISLVSLALLAACQVAPPAVATAPAPPAVPAPASVDGAPVTPAGVVAAASAREWIAIAPEDLLVMTLAPDAKGKPREVVIQLLPAPYSAGWTGNIRDLARQHWFDGTAIVRVQDNYVVQWGDPEGENPAKARPLPAGLRAMSEAEYVNPLPAIAALPMACGSRQGLSPTWLCDPYAPGASFKGGWPIATDGARDWPVHCYGMVGVGRGVSPDTGTGAELYTVIGHAPRQLDRNIALVGRIVEGMQHLTVLPRGTGDLGFYETAAERTPILSVRLASEIPAPGAPRFEYLDTEGLSFRRYAEARANRRDDFYVQPAGGVDVCNVPVPVRRHPAS